MSYTPTVYVNGQSPALSATNLNKSENGIKDAHDLIAELDTNKADKDELGGFVEYITTAPTEPNTEGLKFVVLNSEPSTKYSGYIYFIKE